MVVFCAFSFQCETPLIVSPSSQGQGGQSVASRFGYTAGNAQRQQKRMRGWNKVITAATQAILNTYITINLHVYSQKKRDVCFRELSRSLVSMYLAWKYLVKTLYLRPLLETGPPFYALIPSYSKGYPFVGQRHYLHFSVILRP